MLKFDFKRILKSNKLEKSNKKLSFSIILFKILY